MTTKGYQWEWKSDYRGKIFQDKHRDIISLSGMYHVPQRATFPIVFAQCYFIVKLREHPRRHSLSRESLK